MLNQNESETNSISRAQQLQIETFQLKRNPIEVNLYIKIYKYFMNRVRGIENLRNLGKI